MMARKNYTTYLASALAVVIDKYRYKRQVLSLCRKLDVLQ